MSLRRSTRPTRGRSIYATMQSAAFTKPQQTVLDNYLHCYDDYCEWRKTVKDLDFWTDYFNVFFDAARTAKEEQKQWAEEGPEVAAQNPLRKGERHRQWVLRRQMVCVKFQ